MTRSRIVSTIAALILAATTAAHAQETTERPQSSIGAFWSANFATVSFVPAVDGVTERQWLGGGLSLELSLGQAWSFESRAFWNRRGARLPVSGSNGYQDVSADYISIPLLFKAARGNAVRPYVTGGPEVSVRTRARVRTVAGALDVEEDAASFIRRVDIALNVGAGVERRLPKARVFVEALYEHGFRNVAASESGEAARTRTLTLFAGLRF